MKHLLPAQGASSVPPSPIGAGLPWAEYGAWWEDVVNQTEGTWEPGRDASCLFTQLGSESSGTDRLHRVGPTEGRGKASWSTGEWG